MTNFIINDLSVSRDLDKAALTALRGGHGIGFHFSYKECKKTFVLKKGKGWNSLKLRVVIKCRNQLHHAHA